MSSLLSRALSVGLNSRIRQKLLLAGLEVKLDWFEA